MSTLGTLIENVRHMLAGFDASKDAVAALSASLDASATTVSVTGLEIAAAGRGVAEVDMELLAVKSVDQTSGTVTLWPFGRGYRATTAASHSSGAEIRFNPAWPAVTVARAINDAIIELYPSLYKVAEEETTVPSDYGALDLTATPVGVISVWVENTATNGWVREDRWDFNPDRSDDGRNLVMGGHYPAGTAVRVVYADRPATFNLAGALSQDFATVTGLDARFEPLIPLAVAYRLAAFVDSAKLPFLAAEARADGETRQGNTGASLARLLYTLFQGRLQEEARVLAKEHPIRLHRVR